MELRELIDTAAKACGNQKALATALDIHPNNLTNAKRGERGLTPTQCVVLADLLSVDRMAVIAANERATAKTEQQRNFWKKVAGFGFAAFISGAALPPETQAGQDSMSSSLRINVDYVNSWTRCATICPNPPSVSMLIEACDSPTSFFGQGS